MQNAGLDEEQAGIKIAGRNINNLRYANDTTLIAEKWKLVKREQSRIYLAFLIGTKSDKLTVTEDFLT